MTDVDTLEDALEVSDVVEQAAVEHLDHQFEEPQRVLLRICESEFVGKLVWRKKESIFCFDVTKSATKSVHVSERVVKLWHLFDEKRFYRELV